VGQFFTADFADLHRLLLSIKNFKSRGSVPSVPSVANFFTADLVNYFPYLITIKVAETVTYVGYNYFKLKHTSTINTLY
jgi:hypothetical protein